MKVTEFTEIYNRSDAATAVVRMVTLKINKNKIMKLYFRRYKLFTEIFNNEYEYERLMLGDPQFMIFN